MIMQGVINTSNLITFIMHKCVKNAVTTCMF